MRQLSCGSGLLLARSCGIRPQPLALAVGSGALGSGGGTRRMGHQGFCSKAARGAPESFIARAKRVGGSQVRPAVRGGMPACASVCVARRRVSESARQALLGPFTSAGRFDSCLEASHGRRSHSGAA